MVGSEWEGVEDACEIKVIEIRTSNKRDKVPVFLDHPSIPNRKLEAVSQPLRTLDLAHTLQKVIPSDLRQRATPSPALQTAPMINLNGHCITLSGCCRRSSCIVENRFRVRVGTFPLVGRGVPMLWLNRRCPGARLNALFGSDDWGGSNH